MSTVRREAFDGILFDMDGTLISSIGAVEAHWNNIGTDLKIPPEILAEALVTMHGTRSIDVLRTIAPENANWEYVQKMEPRLLRDFASSATEIPGTKALVASLDAIHARWGIVTSGTRPLVTGWLDVLNLAKPSVLVTSEEVERGKPDPLPYTLGRQRLGVEAEAARVLVGEDSPTGTRAGKAAGCFVVGVLSSATVEELRAAGADAVVRDWRQVRVVGGEEGGVVVEIEGDLLLEGN